MGAVKRLLEESDLKFQACECPPNPKGMHEMCKSCIAEYEEQLEVSFQEVDGGEFVLVAEKFNRESQE